VSEIITMPTSTPINEIIKKQEDPYFGNGPSINNKQYREYYIRKMLEPFDSEGKDKEQQQ
jgi:hypothetical protein